jgi:hypothetical protein
MLIKCQKCGHENQLGAIFCRSCGDKLDIETIRPEVGKSRRFNVVKTIRKLVTIFSFLVLAGVTAAIFIPSGFKDIKPLEEEAKEKTKEKFEDFMAKIEVVSKQREFTFSLPEATYIFNNFILAPQEDRRRDLVFDATRGGRLNFITYSMILDKVPLRVEISGRIIPIDLDENEDNADNMAFKYNVLSVNFGHMPIPSAISEKILEKFKPLLENERVVKILKAIEKIELDYESGIIVTIKKQKKKDQKK